MRRLRQGRHSDLHDALDCVCAIALREGGGGVEESKSTHWAGWPGGTTLPPPPPGTLSSLQSPRRATRLTLRATRTARSPNDEALRPARVNIVLPQPRPHAWARAPRSGGSSRTTTTSIDARVASAGVSCVDELSAPSGAWNHSSPSKVLRRWSRGGRQAKHVAMQPANPTYTLYRQP
jgi:hypothetical protein